ncbi:MAG: DNA-protecting protein DprA [Gammaproteobacteria bacterium]|nr:DNA-protecting protein DprA [Gammaproteobacteria bacterium]
MHARPQAFACALEALLEASRRSGVPGHNFTERLASRARTPLDWAFAERTLTWLRQTPTASLVLLGEPGYPLALASIADPPPVLFARGDPALLARTQLAVVGSRAATPSGLAFAAELASALCHAGFAVTSGLARGIDGAAHRGALAAAGATLAVLGCGIDRIYPPQHRQLAEQIEATGLVLSELPLGAGPLPHHFPRRNRIISGMAAGLVVVEAGLASGSLLTARAALEQGREVFAVPGAVRNPQARGCHALIREGAMLTESVEDVLTGLPRHVLETLSPATLAGELPQAPESGNDAPGAAAHVTEPGDEQARQVLAALDFEPVSASLLVMRTGLTMHTLSSILLTLELSGRVRALPGGAFERVR